MPAWALFTRDANYRLTGGLHLSSFSAVVKHLGVDTAIVETPYSADAYTRTARGAGIVVQRDGRQEFSGVISSERSMSWDAATAQPTIKVQVEGDDVHVATKLVYPDPSREGHDQTTLDKWTYTGPASTAMWILVQQQVGPLARVERRVPAMFMGADPGVGTVRLWTAAFEKTLDACAGFSALSTPSPGLRFATTPDGLRADVYAPRDLSAGIRFSADLGNLAGFNHTETAPKVTYALVAGQGDLRNRMRRSATSANPGDLAWGVRREEFIDRRDESDATALTQAATDAITEGAGQVNLSCTLTDSQAATYGRDWQLGDQVTVYVGLPGEPRAATVVDLVREIRLEVNNEGAETIRPAIGTFDAKAIRPTPTQEQLADVSRALGGMFARK